jgi:hypothetical protein
MFTILLDGGGKPVLTFICAAGWNVDFGLIYEECDWTPASDNWGQTRIKDWESCTYRQANQTAAKRGRRGLY